MFFWNFLWFEVKIKLFLYIPLWKCVFLLVCGPIKFSESKGLYSKRSLGNTSISCLTLILLVFTAVQWGKSSHCHCHQTLCCHHSDHSLQHEIPPLCHRNCPRYKWIRWQFPPWCNTFSTALPLVSQQAHNNHSSLVKRTARFSTKTHQLHCSHEWHISLVPCQFYCTKLIHKRW